MPEVMVAPAFSASEAGKLLNGVATGIIDVFPYDSNPQRCLGNSTQAYNAVNNLYGKVTGANPISWTSNTDLQTFFTDVSDLLKSPFGLSYSCWWGFSTVLINEDPDDYTGTLTPEQELEQLIEITN